MLVVIGDVRSFVVGDWYVVKVVEVGEVVVCSTGHTVVEIGTVLVTTVVLLAGQSVISDLHEVTVWTLTE